MSEEITKYGTQQRDDLLTGIVADMTAVRLNFQSAGRKIVHLIDHCKMDIASIAEALPGFGTSSGATRHVLQKLELVGRDALAQELVLADWPAVKMLKKLPISEQRKCLEHGVAYLMPSGNEHLQIAVENASSAQCAQVFDANEGIVRDMAGQRAYIEHMRAEAAVMLPVSALPELWRVRGRSVIFSRGCEITSKQLAQILGEMQP